MNEPRIVSREDWLEARRELLAQEKAFTAQRDALSARRRELPWVRVEKDYAFTGADGDQTLSDLFGDHSQLLVHHFMFGKDWEEGCPSCSFWADNMNGCESHLAHRDISFVAVSNAPYAKLDAYRRRMGWDFTWVSSEGCDFNSDFDVSFTPEAMASGKVTYNYRETQFPREEAPGASAFYKDEQGQVFHTYSCYSRGLDILNGAYHWMDIAPKGRNESDLPFPMAWLKRHDQYAV